MLLENEYIKWSSFPPSVARATFFLHLLLTYVHIHANVILVLQRIMDFDFLIRLQFSFGACRSPEEKS